MKVLNRAGREAGEGMPRTSGRAKGRTAVCRRLAALAFGILAFGLVAAGPWGSRVLAAPPAEPAGGTSTGDSSLSPQVLLEEELSNQAQTIGLDDVQAVIDELNKDMQGELPPINIRDVANMLLRGQGPYTFSSFVKAVGARLWREVAAGSGLLGRLVVLALLCGLLQNIQSAFARKETSDLAFGACYLVLIILAVGAFILAMQICQGVIDRVVDFMEAMVPVMITLLAGLGAVTTASLLNPVLVTALGFVATTVRDVLIPIIVCAACIDLVSKTFTRFKLTALADLLKQGSVIVTGVLIALFLGLVAAYGGAGSVFDGVAIKAAKFATSNFIPFIGKILSDAVEVVVGSSLILKNGVGVAGALAVVAFTVFPLLKVVSLVVVYRVAGAVVQPLGAGELVGSLQSVGNSLVLMAVMACAVSVMFVITLAIVVGAATGAVMIR